MGQREGELDLADLDFTGEPTPKRQASAGLLLRYGRVLLEFRSKDVEVAPNVWDAPGGNIEKNESPEVALARELKEELGVDVRRAALLLVRDLHEEDGGKANRSFLYLVREWEGDAHSREGNELRWFTPKDALALPDLRPVTRLAIERCMANLWWRQDEGYAQTF